jgi:hypothetical protein
VSAGTIVRHPKRPEWGVGEVLSVLGDMATVRFSIAPAGETAVKHISLRYVAVVPVLEDRPRYGFTRPSHHGASQAMPSAC